MFKMLPFNARKFFKVLGENFPELPPCEGVTFLHFVLELLNETSSLENNIPENDSLCHWPSKAMAAYAFFFVAGLLSDDGMAHYTSIITNPGFSLEYMNNDSVNFTDTLCEDQVGFFVDRLQNISSEQMENRLYILSKFMRYV
jgi:hypothetical protein